MSRPRRHTLMAVLGLVAIAIASCAGPEATAGLVSVGIVADGETRSVDVPSGTTSQQALALAGITLGALDRVEPPGYTVLTAGTTVRVVRVAERFETQAILLPFEQQTIRNEALPEGETRLLQPGQNGLQEITYRIIEEGGVEVSRSPVQTIVVQEPVPEITMVGAQAAYTTLPIEGTLAYLAAGNAWIIRNASSDRRPLVVTGDLDGRIFQLSPDGRWLLFTRSEPEADGGINSLWAISTVAANPDPIDLNAVNVVLFADWAPTTSPPTVAYSTVEPSPSPPGWQANNDLVLVTFASSGRIIRQRTLVAPTTGGEYGWWGTDFAWATDTLLAFARADSVGLVDLRHPQYDPLVQITPLQTLGEWAWVPGISWGRDDRTLFFLTHGAPLGMESPAASPAFHLAALDTLTGAHFELSPLAGMFANPVASPALRLPSGELAYQVAFLQAVSPMESADSRYRLIVMDRDGSNQRTLFPPQGELGLEPQVVAWSPDSARLALLYRGNVWVVDVKSGVAQPVTGDGQGVRVDWAP
jgi:hypothetical protein